jgi:hypothetical protein
MIETEYQAHGRSDIVYADDFAPKSDRLAHLVVRWNLDQKMGCAKAWHAAVVANNLRAEEVVADTAPAAVSAEAEGPCWLEV